MPLHDGTSVEASPPDATSAPRVGVLSSPSSTTKLSVEVSQDAALTDLVGQMVMATKQMAGGKSEYALGTVREIETYNQWHENPHVRGLVGQIGPVPHLSGIADVRKADVAVQSVFAAEDGGTEYAASGASLSMSPETGTDVHKVTDAMIDKIVVQGDDVFYPGSVYRMPDVRMPFNTPHFDTPRGAFHCGFFGVSGAGKTALAMYYMAGQLRHTNMAMLVVDPQQQFSDEQPGEVPFSLQQLADAQGREVRIFSLAREIRLPKNSPLFFALLDKVKFFSNAMGLRQGEAKDAALYQLGGLFKSTTFNKVAKDHEGAQGADWTEQKPRVLLEIMANHLKDNADYIYKTKDARENLHRFCDGVIADPETALDSFAPVLSLFAPTALDGTRRTKLAAVLHRLNDTTTAPRPYFVLNMSASAFGGADVSSAVRESLDSREAKSVILLEVLRRLERLAEEAYTSMAADGPTKLNVMVAFDEAARYAPAKTDDDDVKALVGQLTRAARETRKYGVGWLYILQEPHTLDTGIWAQLSSGFRAFGYGLIGQSIRRIEEVVDSAETLNLYRAFPAPQATHQYPFMVCGTVSPLSVTAAPVFLNVQTSPAAFASANAAWWPADHDPDIQPASRSPVALAAEKPPTNDPFAGF